jgi:hypothetical protein
MKSPGLDFAIVVEDTIGFETDNPVETRQGSSLFNVESKVGTDLLC